jgi:hypothetical protein
LSATDFILALVGIFLCLCREQACSAEGQVGMDVGNGATWPFSADTARLAFDKTFRES